MPSASSPNSQPSPQLKPGVYRHYKGKSYLVLMTGRLESNLEEHVVYVPLYDMPESPSRIWIRSLDDFTASLQVNGLIKRRFEYVGPQ